MENINAKKDSIWTESLWHHYGMNVKYFCKGIPFYLHSKRCLVSTTAKRECIVLDPGIQCDNLGDEVISHYCREIFSELNFRILASLPTQVSLTSKQRVCLNRYREVLKIFSGTNGLITHIFRSHQWIHPDKDLGHLLLMGVGVDRYGERMDWATEKFYKCYLEKNYLHSVRDSWTEHFLKMMGIDNVVNTACPTMWKLTPEFCSKIPTRKSDTVVATVTDYAANTDNDWYMLDALLEHYRNVYLWLQGAGDETYVNQYPQVNRIKFIHHSLKAYMEFLASHEVDYVGTRLHAGIMALNYGKRTLIIAVDKRGSAIADDTGLPVLSRHNLCDLENNITQSRKTEIILPKRNIKEWKAQFDH